MSKFKLCVVLALGGGMLASPAIAIPVGSTVQPLIVAGDPNGTPPDSPANRVDPNVASSLYSGVVSINIRYSGSSFICSGALIDATHVLTAGHCIDTNGMGHAVDISQPGNDVRVVFNAAATFDGLITASKVTMHPDYKGFGNCPAGVNSFCVNDDLAIIELPTPAPAAAQIYSVHFGAVPEGSVFTMVGYGTSGNGVDGFNVSPSFFVKRSGANIYDFADLDDEKNFLSGGPEVWYADFDGNGNDTFCDLGIACSGDLGNDIEAALGGGDSGGPSFMWFGDRLQLVANNTFSGTLDGQVPGTFGTFFGGILLSSYFDWIRDNSDTVPEPGTLGLAFSGFAALAFARRRKRVA